MKPKLGTIPTIESYLGKIDSNIVASRQLINENLETLQILETTLEKILVPPTPNTVIPAEEGETLPPPDQNSPLLNKLVEITMELQNLNHSLVILNENKHRLNNRVEL